MDTDTDPDTDTQPWPLGSVAQKKKLGTWRQHFAFVADIKMLKISICYKGPEYNAAIWAQSNSLPLKCP